VVGVFYVLLLLAPGYTYPLAFSASIFLIMVTGAGVCLLAAGSGDYRLQRVLLENQNSLTIFGYLAILPNNIITMPEVVLLSY